MNQPLTISLNGFTAIQDEDGKWLYKATGPTPLKKKVIEKPSLKVIEEIEKNYLDYFEKMLVATVKEITKEIV